jgi:hypothetical protein
MSRKFSLAFLGRSPCFTHKTKAEKWHKLRKQTAFNGLGHKDLLLFYSALGKEPTVENSTTSSADCKTTMKLDPVSLVTRVIKDIYTNEEKESPRSRFITRMIPVQTTCFANVEGISRTSKQLIDSCFPIDTKNYLDCRLDKDNSNNENVMSQKISFEIIFKRRLCSNVTQTECIDAVARHFDDNRFNVDLKNPEYTFLMEICKSLVCMCLVRNFRSSCHNFDLFQISEKAKEYLVHTKPNDAIDDEQYSDYRLYMLADMYLL